MFAYRNQPSEANTPPANNTHGVRGRRNGQRNTLWRTMATRTTEPVSETIALKRPVRFPQSLLTCWASAIASWSLVKGFVKQGFSDQYLIDHYSGTPCVDSTGALDGVETIQQVYAAWRLGLDLSSGIDSLDMTFAKARQLLENHGHFILVLGSETLHSVVVYGAIHHNKSDAYDFSFLITDPNSTRESIHRNFISYPAPLALGLPKRAKEADCRAG